MHPLLNMFVITFSFLTLWMLYEAFKVFAWPRLKPLILARIEAYEAIRLHEANQLANKLKALKANEVLEVKVEEVEGLVWQDVKYNTRKTKHIVLEINETNANKGIRLL